MLPVVLLCCASSILLLYQAALYSSNPATHFVSPTLVFDPHCPVFRVSLDLFVLLCLSHPASPHALSILLCIIHPAVAVLLPPSCPPPKHRISSTTQFHPPFSSPALPFPHPAVFPFVTREQDPERSVAAAWDGSMAPCLPGQ